MSCEACEAFQGSDQTSYFRWGRANVEVRACAEHLKEVFDTLRAALASAPAQPPEPKSHTVCIGWPTIRRLKAEGQVYFAEHDVALIAADDLFAAPAQPPRYETPDEGANRIAEEKAAQQGALERAKALRQEWEHRGLMLLDAAAVRDFDAALAAALRDARAKGIEEAARLDDEDARLAEQDMMRCAAEGNGMGEAARQHEMRESRNHAARIRALAAAGPKDEEG